MNIKVRIKQFSPLFKLLNLFLNTNQRNMLLKRTAVWQADSSLKKFALFKKIISRSLHEQILDAVVIKSDRSLRKYLYHQLHRTLSKTTTDDSKRVIYLINRLKEKIDLSNSNVLCVGCRTTDEIDYFKAVGATNVVGIDLFSHSEDVLVMDMHYMTFENDTYDIIFSSHSLEHAKDYKKVIKEFVRVAKDGAIFVIEVPVKGKGSSADLWDFESLDNLKSIFQPYIDHVLFEETLPCGAEHNFSGSDIIRLIFKVNYPPTSSN